MPWVVLVSLIAVLIAALFSLHGLLAFGTATLLVGLVGFSDASRRLLMVFWIWLEITLLYLVYFSGDRAPFWFGLPLPAWVMLLGVWLIPVLIWPLGFAKDFRKWLERE
jgi:hypothetical protein